MGKNGKFGKDYGKVVGKDSKSRPGWKGPGYVKKAETAIPKPKADQTTSDNVLEPMIPIELQQLLLNIFRDAFPEVLASDGRQALLQDVKAALYERDFKRAFGREDYLEAYSIRWSPSRALCYASILVDIRKHLAGILPFSDPDLGSNASVTSASVSSLHAVCFGGGAAEIVAFGGFLRYLNAETMRPDVPDSVSTPAESDASGALESLSISDEYPQVSLLLIDTAQWGEVVNKLHNGLTNPPPLSKYASSSARKANTALINSGKLSATFRAEDVLELDQGQIREIFGKTPMLITLLFTLNELYTTSIGKTTGFLLNLTESAPPGTLLLVVDSPGSYSETTLGTEAKKYPMLWLLNHTLLETKKSRGQENEASWTKVVSDESQWFRLHESLRYPINLENMRYQVHLYQRT